MFLHSKNNITFTEDILEELAKRTGKDIKLVEEIVKVNLKYVHEQMRDKEDLFVINFPNLGKLRYNYYLGLAYISTVTDHTKKAKARRKALKLKEVLKEEDGIELKNFNYPLVYTAVYALKGTYNNAVKDFYKNWNILEEEHNKNHAKYFKKG